MKLNTNMLNFLVLKSIIFTRFSDSNDKYIYIYIWMYIYIYISFEYANLVICQIYISYIYDMNSLHSRQLRFQKMKITMISYRRQGASNHQLHQFECVFDSFCRFENDEIIKGNAFRNIEACYFVQHIEPDTYNVFIPKEQRVVANVIMTGDRFDPRFMSLLYEIMMTSSNGNIFRVTGPLCGEFTGPGELPTQRPVTRELCCFLWSASE